MAPKRNSKDCQILGVGGTVLRRIEWVLWPVQVVLL
jgi:hypothetical protein